MGGNQAYSIPPGNKPADSFLENKIINSKFNTHASEEELLKIAADLEKTQEKFGHGPHLHITFEANNAD